MVPGFITAEVVDHVMRISAGWQEGPTRVQTLAEVFSPDCTSESPGEALELCMDHARLLSYTLGFSRLGGPEPQVKQV